MSILPVVTSRLTGVSSTRRSLGERETVGTGSKATEAGRRAGTCCPVRGRPMTACSSKVFRTGLVTQQFTMGTPGGPASYPTDVSICRERVANCGSAWMARASCMPSMSGIWKFRMANSNDCYEAAAA